MEPDPAYRMVEEIARKHKVQMVAAGYQIERPYASREIVMGAADLINEANPDRESDLMRQLADQVTSSTLPHPVRTRMDTQPFRVIDDVEFTDDGPVFTTSPSSPWVRIPGISDPQPEGSDVVVTSPLSIFGPGFADGALGAGLCDPDRGQPAQIGSRPNKQEWEVVTSTPEDMFGPGFHDEPPVKAAELSGDGVVFLPEQEQPPEGA
jgi:hypothetical protein